MISLKKSNIRCWFGANSGSHLHQSSTSVISGSRAIEAEHLYLVHAQCTGVHGVALNFGARFFEIQLLFCFKCFKTNETISLFLTMLTVIHTHPHNKSIFLEIHPPTCPCLGGKCWQRLGDRNHNPFRFGRRNRKNKIICQENALSGFSPCTRHQEKHGPC